MQHKAVLLRGRLKWLDGMILTILQNPLLLEAASDIGSENYGYGCDYQT